MVGVSETQSWHRAFDVLAANSRWDLGESVIEKHMALAFQLVMEVLSGQNSIAKKLDPSGESSLHLAKKIRLDAMRNRIPNDRSRLRAMADESFGLPDWEVPFWEISESQHRRLRSGIGFQGPQAPPTD
jgi:hypothetical protein